MCYNTSSAEKLRAKKWVPKWCVFGVGEPAAGYRNPSMPASFLLIRSTVCSTKSVACATCEGMSPNSFNVRTDASRPGSVLPQKGCLWGVPKRPLLAPQISQGRHMMHHNAVEIRPQTFENARPALPTAQIVKHEVRGLGRCRSTRFRPRRSPTGCPDCAPGAS